MRLVSYRPGRRYQRFEHVVLAGIERLVELDFEQQQHGFQLVLVQRDVVELVVVVLAELVVEQLLGRRRWLQLELLGRRRRRLEFQLGRRRWWRRLELLGQLQLVALDAALAVSVSGRDGSSRCGTARLDPGRRYCIPRLY